MPHQCTSCGRTFADGSKEMLSGCPDCGGNKFQFKPAEAVDREGSGAGGRSGGSGASTQKKRPADAPETEGDRGRGTTGATRATPDANKKSADQSAVDRAAATVRDWVGSGGESGTATETAKSSTEARSQPDDDSTVAPEDSAQASARRDVVSREELPEDPPENAVQASTGEPTTARTSTDGQTPTEGESAPDAPGDAATRDESRQPAPADDNVVDAPDDENPGLEDLREELNSQFESIRIESPGQYELNLMELYEREEYIISLQEDGKYVIEVPDAWDAADR
ncbi:OapC/ArvC family zinc-ribbon domain-containing protein [Halorussus litoreus]|uniref:OapC/ArvC family zinc-ribbon domain-containing protein n=1 Tax=Halorussus litoreus TaxID=1710536 RepID=UPI000E27E9AB|nr:Zn-ribbon containing protein [Halorussus litoreus]